MGFAAATVAGLLALAGCSSSESPQPPSGSAVDSPASSSADVPASTSASADVVASPCGRTTKPVQFQHVVWIILENRGPDQVVGSPDAPYFNDIAKRCGSATNAHAERHPSLPNYIAMTSGDTQGITNDAPPADHPLNVPSIFSQLGPNKWRSLSESMPSNCYKQDSGAYVPRHNPPTYYTNIADQCAQQAVPLGAEPDISAPFTFIAPNQKHNTHDTDVAAGDAFLQQLLPQLLQTPEYRNGDTAIFVTFDEDEDEGNPANPIPMLVISPTTKPGTQFAQSVSHYSMLRATEGMLGLPYLGKAANAPDMRAAFNL